MSKQKAELQVSIPEEPTPKRLEESSEATTAIVVCGGGIGADGKPLPWGMERCQTAKKLFNQSKDSDKTFVITTSAGTTHKPMGTCRETGFHITESESYARATVELGVPAENILMENSSFDTIGNAFFTRLGHIDPLGIKKVVVVSSEFHIKRVEAIFKKVFSLPPQPNRVQLEFVGCPNVGLDEEAVKARVEKENSSLTSFLTNSSKYNTVGEFHKFVHTEHVAYSASKLGTLHEQRLNSPKNNKCMQSY